MGLIYLLVFLQGSETTSLLSSSSLLISVVCRSVLGNNSHTLFFFHHRTHSFENAILHANNGHILRTILYQPAFSLWQLQQYPIIDAFKEERKFSVSSLTEQRERRMFTVFWDITPYSLVNIHVSRKPVASINLKCVKYMTNVYSVMTFDIIIL